jgi:AAHS family 4-hydroxybenzoate transporter-like MFS transporter
VSVASSGLAAYNFGGVLGVLVWTALLTRFGSRRPLLIGGFAAIASAMVVMFIPAQSHGGSAALIGSIFVNGLFANAVQTSLFALAAHIYPAAIRASGIAYASSIGRIGGLISSLAGAGVIQAGASAYWLSLAAAMTVAVAGIAWMRNHFSGSKTPQWTHSSSTTIKAQ